MQKKTFILDTNILLQSPNAIFGFDDNDVVVTGTTLQELDKKKKDNSLKYNARETARILDHLREKGDLKEGVPLPNGGNFYIALMEEKERKTPLDLKKGDNQIIETTIQLMEKHPKCILVTNDAFMRITAASAGISVESYKNDEISEDEYTGKTTIYTLQDAVNELYKEKEIIIPETKLIENQYVIIKGYNSQQSALAQYRKGTFHLIPKMKAYGITPLNASQSFALHALLAPVDEIPLVIMRGPAGCAKTFLSLAAGLDQTYDDKKEQKYRKIMITRNNVTNDEAFGYLPGELEEKMAPLIAPFYDNLEALIRGSENESNEVVQNQLDYLFSTGTIEIAPMAYMRGRSIQGAFLILDEAQNSTISQIRDVITRAGKGTKIVICGDPNQIDSPYLNEKNNGLNFAASVMKGSPIAAQITFDSDECVRSVLAQEAIRRMY